MTMTLAHAAAPRRRRGRAALGLAATLLLAACAPAAIAATGPANDHPGAGGPTSASGQPGAASDPGAGGPTSGNGQPGTVSDPGAGGPTTSSGQPGRLSVSGAQVLDPRRQPIVLRGYNWGQWGTVQPQDGPDNAAAGANSVRIPLRWWGDWKDGVDSRSPGQPGHIDRDHLTLLDQTVDRAITNHLWVILFVDSNFGQGADGRRDNFWTNPQLKQQFVEVWQFLVHRYLNKPFIGAWEILPEPKPVGVDDDGVRAFYDSIIPVIRAIDPRTPIVVGPNDGYNLRHLDGAHTTVDPNILYTGNYFIFDDALGRIDDILNFRKKYNAPVWINQVGILSGRENSQDKADKVLDAFNDNGIGWAWWTYRVVGTDPTQHGIYYREPASPNRWIVKPEWLELVNSHLKPA